MSLIILILFLFATVFSTYSMIKGAKDHRDYLERYERSVILRRSRNQSWKDLK